MDIEEFDEFKIDYLLCRILKKTPSELADMDPEDLAFLKSGIYWELKTTAERGPLFLF